MVFDTIKREWQISYQEAIANLRAGIGEINYQILSDTKKKTNVPLEADTLGLIAAFWCCGDQEPEFESLQIEKNKKAEEK